MRIQIQRAAEALDKGHRSAADSGVALRPSLLAIPGLNGAEKHRQKSADVRSEGSLEEIVTSHRIPPAAQYPQACDYMPVPETSLYSAGKSYEAMFEDQFRFLLGG